MSLSARAYITLIIGVGAVCFARGMGMWGSHDVVRFVAYLLLAIPAASLMLSVRSNAVL